MSEVISASQNDSYAKTVNTSARVLVLGAGVNHSGSSIASVGWTIELPRVVSVYNSHGSQVLYVGWGSDVSTSNGLPIPAGESRKFRLSYLDEMWAVASGAGTVALVTVVHGKGAVFSPEDLSPALWLDASDASTITESGGAVSTWADKSGNGYDVTQATAANKPTTGTRTLNGLNVVDFDDNDELVSSAAASVWNFLHQTESTIFVVMETDEDELAHQVIRTGAFASSSVGFTVRTNDVGASDDVLEHWVFRGVSSTYVVQNLSASGAFPDATPAILRIESDPQNGTAASRSALYVDSGAAIANNADTSTFSSSDASSTLALGSTSQGINGAIAEVIVVDGTLTADQISATETYLADKWGISI